MTRFGNPPGAAVAPNPTVKASGTIARVALLGGSGYTGQEFARLAGNHAGIRLAAFVSRDPSAASLPVLVGSVSGGSDGAPRVIGLDELSSFLADGGCDTVVTALPHGAWKELAEKLGKELEAVRIVDLSSDFRDGSSGYVYGLPEAFRSVIGGARRIANPGCYPTATALALLPAAENGWIDSPVLVSALSGVSGAGRAAALRTSFVEQDGGAWLYKVGTVHAHVREMEATLGRLSGLPVPVAFAPQVVPMSRGILVTASATLARPVSPEEARETWLARYAAEPFVNVLAEGAWPETRLVRGSNRCDIQVTTLHGGTQLLACAAIDNLVKGAAGQAIQNLNLMMGLPETTGLPVAGVPW